MAGSTGYGVIQASTGPDLSASVSRPLSPAQLPVWYAEFLRRGTPRWTQFSVTTLTGAIDQAKLKEALAAAVAYYPALRTCVLQRRREVRQVFHDAADFRVGWQDLSGLPAEARDRRIAEILAEGERYRFKLYGNWLFRAELVACTPDRTLLLLFMHHIATDGMCVPLVLQRVALSYQGQAAAGQSDDLYERWLDRQAGPDFEAALRPARDFYRRALAGARLVHEQLYDQQETAPPHEPPDLPQSTSVLEPAVVQGLSRLAEQTASTVFIVCLAAFGLALSQVVGSQDLVIAVFVAGRGGESGLVAMAVNTLLVRLRLEGITEATALVQCVKEAWRPVRRLEALPIHALRQPAPPGEADGGVTASEPCPIPNRAQFAINYLDMRGMTLDLPGIASHTTYPQSAFPLNDALLLIFREHDDRLRLRLFNGSGTPRLSATRLAIIVGIMAGVLRDWSVEAAANPPTRHRNRQI